MFKNNKKVLQQEKAPVSLNDSTEQRYSVSWQFLLETKMSAFQK